MPPSICLLSIALACGREKKAEPATPPPEVPPSVADEPPAAIPLQGPLLASPEGMGPVKLCSTVADLRKMVVIGQRVEQIDSWEGDYAAISLSSGEDRLLLVPFPAGQDLDPEAPITWLVTESSRVRTDVGVGPGTPLSFSTTEYGQPTLSYEGESGTEYVRFAQGPEHLLFRVRAPAGEARAGIYPEGPGPLRQTAKFQNSARLGAIELRGDCPEPAVAVDATDPTTDAAAPGTEPPAEHDEVAEAAEPVVTP